MGRSAKTHKRVNKPTTQSRTPSVAQTAVKQSQATAPSAVQIKRKKNLKNKAQAQLTQHRNTSGNDKILGDVDYVTLMLGGRRKAKDEATKMVVDSESS